MLNYVVGANVRLLRKQSRKTIEELALLAELDTSHLGRIERGQQNATLEILHRLALALGVQLHELFNEGVRMPCYPSVNRFIKRNLPLPQSLLSYYDPFQLLDLLGRIILGRVTVDDIEREAAPASRLTIFPHIIKVEDCPQTVYGICCDTEEGLRRYWRNVSADSEKLRTFTQWLNRLDILPENMDGLIENFLNEEWRVL